MSRDAAHSDYRTDLNGLRGLALALVVAFHLQVKGAAGGFIGVDVFFVLSGYLMTRIICQRLDDGQWHYGRFIAQRALRIWPALAVLVLLLLATGLVWLPPFDLERIARQGGWALGFLSNHHFLAGAGYITREGDTQWLLHTWSLSVEWQFYLLYPLWLMLSARLAGPARRAQAMVAGVALLAALSLAWCLLLARRGDEAGFFLLTARAWELLAGGLAYWAASSARLADLRPRLRALLSHAGLFVIVLGAVALAAQRVRPVGAGAWLLLPVTGTVLVLVAGHASSRVFGNALLQRLGTWSYSVYLWHWPLIVGLRLTDIPTRHPHLAVLGTALLSVLLGAASYALVERVANRARTAGSAWQVVRWPLAAFGVAAMAAVLIGASHGATFRPRGEGGFIAGYDASVKALYYPDACSNFKKPASELKTCSVDKSGPARVLVIGDSHAEHLYPWFVAHSGVTVDFYTASECPPVPHFVRQQPGYACQDYAALAWARAQRGPYDTVIVSARWATIGLAGAPYCHQSASTTCTPPATVPAKQVLLRQELARALGDTLAAGKTVVWVDNGPESPLRVAERAAREQFWYGEVRHTVPAASIDDTAAWLQPVLASFAAQPKFQRVSVRPTLCDATRCRLFDSALQRPVFFDESHFDPVWIARQTALFAPYVQPR